MKEAYKIMHDVEKGDGEKMLFLFPNHRPTGNSMKLSSKGSQRSDQPNPLQKDSMVDGIESGRKIKQNQQDHIPRLAKSLLRQSSKVVSMSNQSISIRPESRVKWIQTQFYPGNPGAVR